MASSAPRPARADARRNRERLLVTAREVFARDGVEASLNEVARRAGVGPATLYRHFPTREALLGALLADRYDALAARAAALHTSPSPLDALVDWLRAFVDHLRTFRGLATPVRAALHDERSAMFASCHAMQSSWRALVARAQQAGEVGSDVDPDDLLRVANGIAWAAESDTATHVDRLLLLVIHGVRGV